MNRVNPLFILSEGGLFRPCLFYSSKGALRAAPIRAALVTNVIYKEASGYLHYQANLCARLISTHMRIKAPAPCRSLSLVGRAT
jgi:hypothetical protein